MFIPNYFRQLGPGINKPERVILFIVFYFLQISTWVFHFVSFYKVNELLNNYPIFANLHIHLKVVTDLPLTQLRSK